MTYLAADPIRTVPSYAPPPLPAPTWTPADLGVQLGLDSSHAQFAAATLEASLVAVVASLAVVSIGRHTHTSAGSAEFVREFVRACTRSNSDRLPDLAALVIAVAAVLPIPFGPGWACALEIDAGLIVVVVATTLAASWLTRSSEPRGESAHDEGARLAGRVVVLEFASALAIAGSILFANGASPEAVVDGQRALGLPYGVVQPLGLVVAFLATMLAVAFLDTSSEDPLRRASVAGLLFAKVCICTTAFLGGWWIPGFDQLARWATGILGGHGNVSWQYAIACFLLGSLVLGSKVAGVLVAVGVMRRRLAEASGRHIVAMASGLIAPVAVLNVVALGAVFVIGLPAGQGGVLGFFEATRAGIVVGSRFFGYGYLLAGAVASMLICAMGAVIMSDRTISANESGS
jgi:hypothetical protein